MWLVTEKFKNQYLSKPFHQSISSKKENWGQGIESVHSRNKNKKIPKKKFNKRWHMTIMYKQNYKTLSKDIKEGPKKKCRNYTTFSSVLLSLIYTFHIISIIKLSF